jgi:glycerol-3-phosphate cytidylyltransferase-like family protein
MEVKHKKPSSHQRHRNRARIRCDEVVPQINRNKLAAPTKFGFDVMFVGDDWKGSLLFSEVEAQFKQLGVDVVYLPYTRGTSSTLLTHVLADFVNKK